MLTLLGSFPVLLERNWSWRLMLQEKKVCRQPFFLATEGSVSHRAESLVWCRPDRTSTFAPVPGWTWLRSPGSTEERMAVMISHYQHGVFFFLFVVVFFF